MTKGTDWPLSDLDYAFGVLLDDVEERAAVDEASIMECEWLGGRLPAPPPFADLGPCDGCEHGCDYCAVERAYRDWEHDWERAWMAVEERIRTGDESWMDDFHYRSHMSTGRLLTLMNGCAASACSGRFSTDVALGLARRQGVETIYRTRSGQWTTDGDSASWIYEWRGGDGWSKRRIGWC